MRLISFLKTQKTFYIIAFEVLAVNFSCYNEKKILVICSESVKAMFETNSKKLIPTKGAEVKTFLTAKAYYDEGSEKIYMVDK